MTRNEIKITGAVEADCDEIADIETKCFSVPWTREMISAQISGEGKIMPVAKVGGVIAGYAGMTVAEDEGYISNLAVLPGFRGIGIGKALLARIKDAANEMRLAFVSLEVRVSNAAARSLYESAGFKAAGIRKRYYDLPCEDAVIMTLFLSEERPC